MKRMIRKTLITQMILGATAAFIPGAQATGAQAVKDDFVKHETRVGVKIIPHTVTPGEERDTGGKVIFYDPRSAKDRQLSLRIRERDITYTCPPVPGIKGLEKPRFMGASSVYLTQESDTTRPTPTKIELMRASCNIDGLDVFAGYYRQGGMGSISSKIDKDQRVDAKQLTCRTGQDDGLIINIEFKEFMYHIPYSFSFHKGYLTAKASSAPKETACFTFSCWVAIV